MNKIKIKYRALSKNEKILYLAIATSLTILVIAEMYTAGEIIGAAFYTLTH
jgi:cell division protein FtsL